MHPAGTKPLLCSHCPLPVPQIPSSLSNMGTWPPTSIFIAFLPVPLPSRQGSSLGLSKPDLDQQLDTHCWQQGLQQSVPAHPQPGHISQLHTVKEHCLLTRNIPSWGTLLTCNKEQSTPQRDSSCQRQVGRTENWWPREGK